MSPHPATALASAAGTAAERTVPTRRFFAAFRAPQDRSVTRRVRSYRMTYLDEYQWRYRQPAPSLHEAFAEMATNRSRQWHRQQQRWRAVVALAALLVLGLTAGALCVARRWAPRCL
jgi:anti-sigma-K factor RskA